MGRTWRPFARTRGGGVARHEARRLPVARGSRPSARTAWTRSRLTTRTSRTTCCEPGEPMRVAAIDIGSNSIRLLVADVDGPPAPESLVTLARAGEPCRLGRGLERTGAVEPSLADRAASLVTEFRRRAL